MVDTSSEAHRHACEVRYVMALPTRYERTRYLEGIEAKRGKPAAERLRADVMAAWQQRAPAPHVDGESRGARSVHATGEPHVNEPPRGDGSFLASADAGNSDPVTGVVSEGAAR